MNYQRIYDEIIKDSRITSPIGHIRKNNVVFKEQHHIWPRCLARDKKDPLLDIPSNLIFVTPRRHFILHRLLAKIYPNNRKIIYGFQVMFRKTKMRAKDLDWQKSMSKSYDLLKQQVSEFRKTQKLSLETKQKISKALIGRPKSDSTKLKLSIAHKGKTISVEQRAKLSAANMGKKLSLETISKIIKTTKGKQLPALVHERAKIAKEADYAKRIYQFYDPQQTKIIIIGYRNLLKFYELNQLSPRRMARMMCGEHKQYKGYRKLLSV